MVVKMEKSADSRYLVSCSVVGDGMVGKTCLSQAFTMLTMPKDYVATVFENYAGTTHANGDEYLVNIFDTAGQHDYASLRQLTYDDSEVIVLCYSAVDRDSFNSITEFWVPEIKPNKQRKRPIILVATQTDLRDTTNYDSDMPVSQTEGATLAKNIGATCYMECSASDSSSVKKIFTEVVQAALKCRKRKSNIVHKILGK
ncbi:hypothetical protein ACF0H5_003216 [Mactra antiquata]